MATTNLNTTSKVCLNIDSQCPVCLKVLSSKRYLHKHLFDNKKRCSPAEGHTPPTIDYENKVIGEYPVAPVPAPAPTLVSSLTKAKPGKSKKKDPSVAPPPINVKPTNEKKKSDVKKKTKKPKIPIDNKENNLTAQSTQPVSDSTQPEIESDSNTNTVTNRYTIAVDTNGNIVNLPGMQTQNEILRDNPTLLEQVRQIVKNLNINTGDNYRLPPEVSKCHKKIENILEELGDVNSIITHGLNKDLNLVDTIISINLDDENNNVYIERISIPEDLRRPENRDLSFTEILYRGLYHIFTTLITHKFHFYEITRSKKAYEDCNKIMKYRKMVLISYLVLKKRLDKYYLLKASHPESAQKLLKSHETYYKNMTPTHLPYVHQYDNCMLVKLQMAGNLESIELNSLNAFYENFGHLINIYEFKQIINNTCSTLVEDNHIELTEAEVKRRPDYKYINLDHLSPQHKLFPDYDFEIISRDFCSHLVKITPMTLPRKTPYKPVNYYYKRIYIDNTCEAPLTPSEYQQLIDHY